MDMFNRIKSTVGGLIGNPVVSQYDITGLIATGGLDCLWKIYHGVKRSTKQVHFYTGYSSFDSIYNLIFSINKRNLKFQQHFEPVFASLANVLGHSDNLSPVPENLREHQLYFQRNFAQ